MKSETWINHISACVATAVAQLRASCRVLVERRRRLDSFLKLSPKSLPTKLMLPALPPFMRDDALRDKDLLPSLNFWERLVGEAAGSPKSEPVEPAATSNFATPMMNV